MSDKQRQKGSLFQGQGRQVFNQIMSNFLVSQSVSQKKKREENSLSVPLFGRHDLKGAFLTTKMLMYQKKPYQSRGPSSGVLHLKALWSKT